MPAFLDLPPELRNRIYLYTSSLVPTHHYINNIDYLTNLAVSNSQLIWVCDWYWFTNGPYIPPAQPALTRVCRQLRQETLPMFYGANALCIRLSPRPNPREMTLIAQRVRKWFTGIREHVHLMKEVVFEHDWPLDVRQRLIPVRELGFVKATVEDKIVRLPWE